VADKVSIKITLEKPVYDLYKSVADANDIPLAIFLRSVLKRAVNDIETEKASS